MKYVLTAFSSILLTFFGTLSFSSDVSADSQSNISAGCNFRTGYESRGAAFLGFAVRDGLLYGASEDGMDIFRIEPADSPRHFSHVDLYASCWGVAVRDTFAYLTSGEKGLQTISVANPFNPYLISTISNRSGWYRIVVADSLAFVAGGANGLVVLSLATPGVPAVLGTYDTPGNAVDVVVQDSLAFVADGIGGVQIINIANPASPSFFTAFASDTISRVIVSGDRMYTIGLRLSVIDISTLPNTSVIGALSISGSLRDFAVQGNYAYIGGLFAHFRVYDISDPSAPVQVSNPFHWTNYPLILNGNTAWTGQLNVSILRIDITDPTHPANLGKTEADQKPRAVFRGTHGLYVARGTTGVRVDQLQISGATMYPQSLTTVNTPGTTQSICETGSGYLLIADSNAGIQVSSTNSIVGYYNTIGPAIDVVSEGNLSSVATADSGIELLEVSQPSAPAAISRIKTKGPAVASCISSTNLFTAERDSGVGIYEISSAESPVPRGQIDAWNSVNDVSPISHYLAIADDSGLVLADIAYLDAPVIVSRTPMTAPAVTVTTSSDSVFVATKSIGYVFRLIDPTSPFPLCSLTISSSYDSRSIMDDGRIFASFEDEDRVYTPTCCADYIGNVDCDIEGRVDISDIARLIDYLYISFDPPCCPETANYDRDYSISIDIADLGALIYDLYINTSPYFWYCFYDERQTNPQAVSAVSDSLPPLTSPIAE